MSPTLCCFSPSVPPLPRDAETTRRTGKKSPPPAPAQPDHFENISPAKKASASEAATAAMHALTRIAGVNPASAGLTDYQRSQLVLEGLETCVPWLSLERSQRRTIPVQFSQLGAGTAAAGPQAAGMLASVLHAGCIVALQRPSLGTGNRKRQDNKELFQRVMQGIRELPCMGPYQHLLETGSAAAGACLDDGKHAMHGAFFQTWAAHLAATPPPSAADAAFLQQALVALGSVNVDGSYHARRPLPMAAAPASRAAGHAGRDNRDVVHSAHRAMYDFAKYHGGWGLTPKLTWNLGEALSAAATDPDLLDKLFEPDRWYFRGARQPPNRQFPAPRDAEVHQHIAGAMYFALLHHINGTTTRGFLRRSKQRPMDVAQNREFLARAFTSLHHGVMGMPEGWIPPLQLEELHRVALDGLACGCDAHTLRARLQCYIAAAATSPSLANLDAEEAAKTAKAWEELKSRLHTEDYVLDAPVAAS